MESRLEWNIEAAGSQVSVKLIGQINEEAHLNELLAKIANFERIVFDLEKVKRINSIGVREWINFARSIPAGKQVKLSRCSPAIVAQLNMIRNFAHSATIASVCAPYVCDACSHEADVVVELKGREPPTLGKVPCSQCGGQMEMDDFSNSYFSFLGH